MSTSRSPHLPAYLSLLSLLVGCTHYATIERTCGSIQNSGKCTGRMEVPEEKASDFEKAGQLAIDAIYSPEFEMMLRQYMQQHVGKESPQNDWEGLTPDLIIDGLRKSIPTLSLTTYGGPIGALKYYLCNNLAVDGSLNGPIEVNRWGLWRTPASFANTIIHEAAHKAGMHHYDQNRVCAPPYVIGSIVERISEGTHWKWTSAHCSWLAPAQDDYH